MEEAPCVAGGCRYRGGATVKILITGASGHFGGEATRLLLEQFAPADLILMTRKPEKLGAFAELGCTVRYGDFEDPTSLEAAAQGAEKMLLISGMMVGYRVSQHGRAIDAAKAAGVNHIVYTSYIGATADNRAMIAQDHYGTEQLLKASGVAWTAMRDGMYMDSMVEAAAPVALQTGTWRAAAADGKTSFIDRSDCVECAVAVLTSSGHDNRVYNITGTDLWSFRDVSQLIAKVTDKPIDYAVITDDDLYAHFDGLGIPRDALKEFNVDGYAWCSDDMVSYERAMREGHFAVVSDDVEKLIGRKPKGFRDFVLSRAAELRAMASG
jgi:NAD(P)H dehydrogenase (quinone)